MLHSLKNTRAKTEGDGDEARGRSIKRVSMGGGGPFDG